MPRREFLYSDKQSPPINLGCGVDLTIRELAELIKDVVGFTGNLTFDHSKPDGAMQKLLDVSKLKQMGWKATTFLRDGIVSASETYFRGGQELMNIIKHHAPLISKKHLGAHE